MKASFILLFFLNFSSFAIADGYDNECVFDKESILTSKINKPDEILMSHWDNEKNILKGLLKNKHFFSSKYWVCDNYGKKIFTVFSYEGSGNDINNFLISLSDIFLDDLERKQLIDGIKNESFKILNLPIKKHIKTNYFDEFYVYLDSVGDSIYIEIKLYKN